MRLPSIEFVLRLRPRFLEGLAPADVTDILTAAAPRQLSANSIVTFQDDPADYLFLLIKGRARFFLTTPGGQKMLLYWLVPGEIFGLMALLSAPSAYLVSTEIVKNSCVLVWSRSKVRALAARYPRLFENSLAALMSDYLAHYAATRIAVTCYDAEQRLALVLNRLALSIGREIPGAIELDATNEELASAANLSPFTASRLLSGWQRQGIIQKSRGKVVLRSPEQLLRVAA